MTTFLEHGLDTSPLAEIERRVQERAKRLDVHEETTEGLRAIIEDEVARWNVDFQRGLRTFDLADPETVVERAFRNLERLRPARRRSSPTTTSGRSWSTRRTRSS